MDYTNLYINGAWREGAEGKRFDVFNPATEAVLASVASAEIADADAALDAAEAAFADWAGRTPRQRSEVLRKVFELMTARLPDIRPADHAGKRQGARRRHGRGGLRRRILPLVRGRSRSRRWAVSAPPPPAPGSWSNTSPPALPCW